MDFVLTLHGHLPYVLHHGRWPHGSVWLSEGALDSYLPLIEVLQQLERERIRAPITLGITPILANQLAHPSFVSEFEAYMERRLETAAAAPASLAKSGDLALKPIADFWLQRLQRLYRLFRDIDEDLIGTLRGFEDRGAIEIISSAATHGFLPLFARDESIQLQLRVGVSEHRRLFGTAPTGCWLPECAYRPAGPWNPGFGAQAQPYRVGIEQHLTDVGFKYFFVDSHLVHAGPAMEYPDAVAAPASGQRTPYTAYRVASIDGKARDLFALVRDPKSSAQVWSRAQGYPGDEWYLEFHKIRWPDGLRLWRVTGPGVDLGEKRQYDPQAAQVAARNHADHFAGVLKETAARRGKSKVRDAVVTAPFDAELFGHWWFEGVEFLGAVYQRLREQGAVRPVTATRHLAEHPPVTGLRLAEGSWGANGDHSMWLNDRTAAMWQRLWALEDAFWEAAPAALASPAARPVLAQAARELVLAQASDWEFIISTGVVADYGARRFELHCGDAERLIAALTPDTPDALTLEGAQGLAEALWRRDEIFPDILASVVVASSS